MFKIIIQNHQIKKIKNQIQNTSQIKNKKLEKIEIQQNNKENQKWNNLFYNKHNQKTKLKKNNNNNKNLKL